jgi:hypothetical protein
LLPLVTVVSIFPSVAEIIPSDSEISEIYLPLPPTEATSRVPIAFATALLVTRSELPLVTVSVIPFHS